MGSLGMPIILREEEVDSYHWLSIPGVKVTTNKLSYTFSHTLDKYFVSSANI